MLIWQPYRGYHSHLHCTECKGAADSRYFNTLRFGVVWFESHVFFVIFIVRFGWMRTCCCCYLTCNFFHSRSLSKANQDFSSWPVFVAGQTSFPQTPGTFCPLLCFQSCAGAASPPPLSCSSLPVGSALRQHCVRPWITDGADSAIPAILISGNGIKLGSSSSPPPSSAS